MDADDEHDNNDGHLRSNIANVMLTMVNMKMNENKLAATPSRIVPPPVVVTAGANPWFSAMVQAGPSQAAPKCEHQHLRRAGMLRRALRSDDDVHEHLRLRARWCLGAQDNPGRDTGHLFGLSKSRRLGGGVVVGGRWVVQGTSLAEVQ